ncbi:hypothetical protein JXJ21_01275 [candidate division KSB1 bacterium]|nr:hypothetical protein [candidate division KSB1 bacterium]
MGEGFGSVVSAQEPGTLYTFHNLENQRWMKCLQTMKQGAEQAYFDVTFYHINIDISIHSPYVKGDVLCRVNAAADSVREIKLNLHNALTTDSIAGNVSEYVFENDTIYIKLDKSYPSGAQAEVRAYYQGEPQPAAGIAGFQYDVSDGMPKIVTACEPFFSYCWWPCKDGAGDKADSVYIDITIPDTTIDGTELIALSNGILENTLSEGGRKTFQWRERYSIATYYIMVAVSCYSHFQQDYHGRFGEKLQNRLLGIS